MPPENFSVMPDCYICRPLNRRVFSRRTTVEALRIHKTHVVGAAVKREKFVVDKVDISRRTDGFERDGNYYRARLGCAVDCLRQDVTFVLRRR